MRQPYVESGFTKERQSIRPEFQSPIRLGEVGLWFEQVAKQEHFIELGSLVKEMQRMVNDPDFYKSVNANKRLGKEYYGVLQRWINKVANPDIYKAFGDVEKLAKVMRGHSAIAYLSYNLITIMKQAPSVGLFMNEIGPVEIMGGLYQMTTDYANTKKFIHSLSSQMGNRAIERELEEFKRYNPNAYAQIVQRIGEVGMRGIYMMDEYITHSGWIASYNRSIREGLSEAEAAQIADKLVLTTQPAAHVKDLADIYTSNEFLNWFLQFSNQLNQIYNILTYDIPVKAKNGNYFDALRAAMGVGISFLMIHMINKGSVIPFKDEDEAKDFLAESTIATLPVVGPMINSGRKGFDPVSVPALSAVTGLIKSGDYFFKASAARGRKKKQYLGKGFEYGIESVATGLGLPYAQPRRTIKGILDLESGKTQDWRRVIWSSYSLGKDEQKRKRRHSSKR